MAKRKEGVFFSKYLGLLTVFVMLLGILGVTFFFQNSGNLENRISAQTTTQLYKADFSKLWRSVSGTGSAISRIYFQSGTSPSGVIEAIGGGSSLDVGFYLPYNLPTSGYFYTQFDATLQAGYSLSGAIRFNTNQQLPINSYTLWITPATKSWSIARYAGSVPTVLRSGTSAAIQSGTVKNTFKVYRNYTTGALDFYINGTLLAHTTDTTYKGGVNRVNLQSTNDVVKISNFTVFR